jgi:hypothetical protein
LEAVKRTTLELTDVINALPSSNGHPSWRDLSLFWLCSSLLADGKSIPSKDELRALLIPDVSRGWSHIHLFAQLQAIVYSWRILTQCLDVFLTANTMHTTPHTMLVKVIHSIQGFHFPQLLDPVHGFDLEDRSISLLLDAIYSNLGADDRSAAGESKKRNRKRKRMKIDANKPQPDTEKSQNMYDILAELGS